MREQAPHSSSLADAGEAPFQSSDLDSAVMRRAYAVWAPVYDALCGPFFRSGRKAAAAEARACGGDILEIGVGTGLSFGDYAPGDRVTGVDASEEMIALARRRLAGGDFPQIHGLRVMDAMNLGFNDGAFDVAVAQFVLTLVERPERMLDEAARVLRPGGSIVLVNHFYSERGLAAALERGLAKPARRMGLRPDFPFQRIADWARARGDMEVAVRRRADPLGWFTLTRLVKAS